MTEKIDKAGKPSAQVYRLVSPGERDSLQKFVVPTRVDGPANAVQANAFLPEDEYQDLYVGATRDQGVLEPPYNLRTLDRLSQENNALSPCVEAMVTNVAGTGYDFESDDEEVEDDEDDAKIQELREFFREPWPGVSFTTIRQELRRDLERTGNAYLEVLRNAQDEIVFLRHVDAKMMRLLKLDDPIPVEKTVRRKGRDVEITVMQRERRYCQIVNGVSLVFFRDFGASRDLHKSTGHWAPRGQRLPAKDRATEIIHFTCLPDAHTPYGVPRWISQLPSVLGSRKAEEFNLDFFDHGGVPPVLILLQGGTLQAETRQALEQKMSLGSAKSKNRVAVLEVEPTGGSVDHPTPARVTVERFGGERTSDSMFENYDAKCEERVRRSFRLPPIFVGQAADYAFATAFVSYTVAEAQVFKPERDEEDEVISMRLLSALGYSGYRMVSKPMTIEDVQLKLQGIEMAFGTGRVDFADILSEINEACGTSIKVAEDADATLPSPALTVDADGNVVPLRPAQQPTGHPPAAPGDNGTPVPSPGAVAKGETLGILALAKDTLTALRERDFASLTKHIALISTLDPRGMDAFRKASASLQFVDPGHDHEGLGELIGCTLAVMQAEHERDGQKAH